MGNATPTRRGSACATGRRSGAVARFGQSAILRANVVRSAGSGNLYAISPGAPSAEKNRDHPCSHSALFVENGQSLGERIRVLPAVALLGR